MFQNMNDQVLEVICNLLKPVIYNESSSIIREGDPLDRMLFISQGTAWAYKNSSFTDHHVNNINVMIKVWMVIPWTVLVAVVVLEPGVWRDVIILGKNFCSGHSHTTQFRSSRFRLQMSSPIPKLKPLFFMANDLMNAVSRFWWLFLQNLQADHSNNSQAERWKTWALSAVRMLRRGNKKNKTANSAALQLAEGGGKSQRFKYRRLHH